jgi:hypothetical protein
MKQSAGTPTLAPPGRTAGNGDRAGAGTTEPAIRDAAAAGVLTATPQGPAGGPPGAAATTAAVVTSDAITGITGTWHNGVTVDALWAVNEVRNAWMRVVGIGWKKLYNGRDGAFTALVILAGQARETGKPINYREEADGMVYEIYLW